MGQSESGKEKKTLIILDSDVIKDLKSAPYIIKSLLLVENEIRMGISYTGGCKSHDFQLVVNRDLISRPTKYINLNLYHDDNGDRCKKIVSDKLVFDISPLVQRFSPYDLKNDVKLSIDGRPLESFMSAGR